MRFRPCIDIHDGKVKQIVGGSLKDSQPGGEAGRWEENFVSQQDAAFYGAIYRRDGLAGGHIILLNPTGTKEYKEDVEQAKGALQEFPGGFQLGGGITDENASYFLEAGASHVIVTSFVFKNGVIHFGNLKKLTQRIGKEHLVLDLSCRKKIENGEVSYYIVTERWQKFTEEKITGKLLYDLSKYCSEFLVHAVDVEGKARGIERELVSLLGQWSRIPITYAGGVGSFEDLEELKRLGKNKLDVTIGSALDLFGGTMRYEEVLKKCR